MKKIILTLVAVVFMQFLFSQEIIKEESKTVEFKTIGLISISVDTKQSMYMNFGGPSIRFEYKKFGISYNMFPSLRFFYGNTKDNTDAYKTKTTVTPILGTGISLYYKKLAVTAPMYYLPANNVWLMTMGFGYKF